MSDLSWLNSHTPCNRCVRFATTVASGHATLATKRTLLLTWAGLPPAGSPQLCLAHSLDPLVGAGEQRTCKRNSSPARSAIINGLPSRTSNSGDCKWGHFWRAHRWRYAAFQTSSKRAKFQKISIYREVDHVEFKAAALS